MRVGRAHGRLRCATPRPRRTIPGSPAINTEISYVAHAFYVGAVVLGVPACAAMLFCIVFGVRLWLLPAPLRSAPTANPDAILLMLEGMVRVIAAAAGIIGFVGRVVVVLLAVASVAALIFAGALYITGRGLHAHDDWARGVASGLMAWLLLVSLVALAAGRWPIRALAFVLMLGTLYALLALWQGYTV